MKSLRWTILLISFITLAIASCGPKPDAAVGRDLDHYRAQMAKVAPLENEAIAANKQATEGPNANDAAYAKALREKIIPLFESYREDVRRIQPMTETVIELQKLFLKRLELVIEGFKDLEKGARTRDKALIAGASGKFAEGKLLLNTWSQRMEELKKPYPITTPR